MLTTGRQRASFPLSRSFNQATTKRLFYDKMGLIKKAFKLTTIGGAATIGTFFYMTRNSAIISPLSPNDPLYKSSFYQKYNPLNNPATNDICVRKVPLSNIDARLLEKDGKLVEAFCAGVWGGLGMIYAILLTPCGETKQKEGCYVEP